MKKTDRIYVAGHTGLVGSAIVRKLEELGYNNYIVRTHAHLDLANRDDVSAFFSYNKPEYVFLCAAKVGGILANNNFPAEFITENLRIQTNVIEAAYHYGVKKLLFLGSSCVYPKNINRPIREADLLTGPLEETNYAYAIAKIAGIKMCQAYNQQYGTNFITVMPPNLYGPNDNFDEYTAHFIPAMIRKFHEAKIKNIPTVTLWGTGKPKREVMFVDDCAESCINIMEDDTYLDIVNVGTGFDFTIREYAKIIKECVGYTGKIIWDTSKPDGVKRKLLDVGWVEQHRNIKPVVKQQLEDCISKTYEWYKTRGTE